MVKIFGVPEMRYGEIPLHFTCTSLTICKFCLLQCIPSHCTSADSLSSYSMGVWADSEKFPACPSVNYTTAKLYLTRLSPGEIVCDIMYCTCGVCGKCWDVIFMLVIEKCCLKAHQVKEFLKMKTIYNKTSPICTSDIQFPHLPQ